MGRAGVAIGVMCKPPRVGVSKTRLAADIGGEAAARLSAAFLKDVAASAGRAAHQTGAIAYAVYAPADAEEELRSHVPAAFRYLPQREKDLGLTMQRAIADLIALGHQGAVILGADTPTLPDSILIEAVEVVRAHPETVVIGPARDGGYYLIGMHTPQAVLFSDVPWSTPEVLAITLEHAARAGLPVHLLAECNDVDDGASLEHLRRELSGLMPASTIGPAAETRHALIALGLYGDPLTIEA